MELQSTIDFDFPSPAFSEKDVKRFWSHVKKGEGADACWLWTLGVDKDGYGWYALNGRHKRAHRVAFLLSRGHIDAVLRVCHTCDNPKCVRPDHLFQGTDLENMQDKVSKGRQVKGDRHWSHLRPEEHQGESNAAARLNNQAVFEIRRLASEGTISQRELSRKFSVSETAISRIVLRRTWKHI